MNSPDAYWTTGGSEVASRGNSGIQINTTSTTTTSTSILTLYPLLTSHGSEYSCNGLLNSSASSSVLRSKQLYLVAVKSEITIKFVII